MKFNFIEPEPWPGAEDWYNWHWQLKNSLKSRDQFAAYFELTSDEERGFEHNGRLFQVRSTPYYTGLARKHDVNDPIRRMIMPHANELSEGRQAMPDPLAENRHSAVERLIHRYPDRVLFLVTDFCSVYCRFCLRKHFTGGDQSFIGSAQYEKALNYIRTNSGISEVIFSGGDPLTLSDERIDRLLFDIRKIGHVEIIRFGTRMPVVSPMRVTKELALIMRKHAPVFVMTHFNHPRELTRSAALAIATLVDSGVPVFNQMVLLNGVNNHPAIVKALSRRLLFLRAKPYYMFQCDPSEGTDHFRISVEESMAIQRDLWGRLSGLAMPNLSLDIPGGGGKVGLVPNFEIENVAGKRSYRGWDGIEGEYLPAGPSIVPTDVDEWA